MNDQTNQLSGFVNDMLAVETELHEAFRRQKHDESVKQSTIAYQVICRTEDTIDRHLSGLKACQQRLGGGESALKKAVGGVMGAVAGMYDKLRSDQSISRALRDDYAALSFATICYQMLHTTALAMKDQSTAECALKHLGEYAPLIMAISDSLPQVVVEELAAEGSVAPDLSVASDSARHTREAWASAS